MEVFIECKGGCVSEYSASLQINQLNRNQRQLIMNISSIDYVEKDKPTLLTSIQVMKR